MNTVTKKKTAVAPQTFIANEAIAPMSEKAIPGKIYLANEDRIAESGFSQGLTTYATGWRDNDPLAADLQIVAPEVYVPARRFDWKKADNSEAFISDTDDIRAPMADFKRVEYNSSEQTSKTQNKGLVIRLERDDKAQINERYVQKRVASVTNRLLRNELRRAVNLLLATGGAGTAKVWNGTTDPEADLLNAIEASADATGIQPDTIIFDSAAWTMRLLAHRANDKAGSFASAQMPMAELAAMLGVQRIAVLRERFTTKKGSGAKSKLMPNPGVIIANIDPMATEEDPSNIKRFVSGIGANNMRVHRDDHHAKFVDITVEHYSRIIATSTIGVQRLNVSTS